MTPSVTPPPIRLTNLTCVHDRHPVVHHVSGVFAPGSLTAIAGPNGAGKTTLLRALAGLHPVYEGSIDRGGLPADGIALLPQAGTLDRSFPLTCGEVVALGAAGRGSAWRRLALGPASAALRLVGLEGFAARPIGALSAGQFQRVLFARMAVQNAPVLLLDEPFNAVDARTTADLLGLIATWHREGRTIVAVLHDLDMIAHAFPQTLLLARTKLAWGPTEVALSTANRARLGEAVLAWTDEREICHEEGG
ncbi:MAG: metal ABC transporter ATP-binding protein [Nevskia sp.]|nr:metal ABC transporter ATP-binding protein [Nevskia sp.]